MNSKVFSLQHARHRIVRAQFDERVCRHRAHPAAVEFNLRLFRIQYFKDLALVGLRVLQDFFLRERHTRLRLAGGVADHAGKVADEKDHLMPEVLKMLELVNQDRMAEVEIRRRGIKPRLDAEWTLFLDRTSQLRFQLGGLDNFNNPSKYQIELLG